MKLQQIRALEGFITLERHVNNPKYSSTAQYSEVAQQYHPRFGNETFELPYYRITKNESEVIYGNGLSWEARSLMHGKNGDIRFFVHPEMREELFPRIRPDGFLRVAPSSSTRTVIMLQEAPGIMIKLHFNKRISRFIRRLRQSSVRHSIHVSNALFEAVNDARCPNHFGFLPESAGVIMKRGNGGIGYLARERASYPKVSQPRYLIPFFALYSKDIRNRDDIPLLLQLAEANSKDPFRFLIEDVLNRFIEGWAFVYIGHGILLEAHGQNTLLEVDEDFRVKRVIHRDFQSVPIDARIRKEKHLPTTFTKHIIGKEDYPNFLEQSLMYDHFIGDYLFNFFEEFCVTHLRRSSDEFRAAVKSIFHRCIPDQQGYFPQGHVIFPKEMSKDNTYQLIYIDEPPRYR